jgi:2,3-bisphosphoglycerate-independent phosphoglycerate mutase
MARGGRTPVGLIVLDGWGLSDEREGNAVALAETPVFDRLWSEFPRTSLTAHGRAVGVREGQIGNSEIGHLNLGAGRVVKQDILRIDDAIEEGSFFELESLVAAAEHARRTGGTLHLMGLLSTGGVHADLHHLFALLDLASRRRVERVVVHPFTDGRDMPPTSGLGLLMELRAAIADRGVGDIATVIGRYHAMDRDRRWDRTKIAYDALAYGRADTITADPVEAVRRAYERGETDEFLRPIVVEGTPRVSSGDAVIFFNFRADRARQLTRAFTRDDFDGFEREKLENLLWITMTEYDRTFDLPVVFPPKELTDVAADVWERAGLATLRIAETEKYAHVTYFFNGGREEPYRGEDRILVPSPKIATYDLQPEMSAVEVTARLVARIQGDLPDAIVLNYANADMVGHTGMLDATIRAVETVDACLGRVVEAFRAAAPEGALLILSDHGNAERMVEPDGSPHTAHTTNPVPSVLVSSWTGALREGGSLRDVAPTLLSIQGLEIPDAMTGRDLRGD